MFGTGVTLSVMAVVVTFLAGVFGAFPLVGGASDADYVTGTQNSETLDFGAVEEVGDMMLLSYTDIIDDLVSFQNDPSLKRAEDRKRIFVEFAQVLTGQFEAFSNAMQGEMDELIAEADVVADDMSQ